MKRRNKVLLAILALVLLVGIIIYVLKVEKRDVTIKTTADDIYIKNGEVAQEEDFTKEDDFIKSQKLDDEYNKISDYGKGYTMNYFKDMDIDASMSQVKTLISNDDISIEVYYDDLTKTEASYEDYVDYSNKFLTNSPNYHKSEFESDKYIKRRKTHILEWSRDKLKHIDNDKNHYVSAKIRSKKNKNEVYTIFIKSSKPFGVEDEKSYMDIIKSFRIIDRQASSKVNAKFKLNDKVRNQETEEFFKQNFLDSEKLQWGIFENDVPAEMEFLNSLEERMDYEFNFVVRYDFFSSPEVVPVSELENAYKHGKTVELTLQTTYGDQSSEGGLYKVLDGEYDDYFKEYAENLKNFGHPVLFRLNNEMNGDWCEYSSYHYSKDTEIFTESWRHIYNIFEEVGVDNVLWVWNPHDISYPNFNWNHYLNYYPGDEFVDIIGLTGYNNGDYYPGEVWRGFEEIYDPLYKEYSEIFEQPFMISEFSANSIGGDKIEWIKDMFENMEKYKKIKVAIWWNWIDWDENGDPARIYRLDESEEMLDTFKEGFKQYK